MKDIIRITIIGGTLLALALLAAPQQASAGDKGYGELKKDLQTAKDDLSKAEATAQENKPDDATKAKEDTLDKLARTNDDTQKNDKGKAAAQKAEDDARDANPVAKGSKAEAYRKALADRREARKKLKKVIADLLDLKRRQQSLSDRDDVETPIKEAREAQKKSESTISLGRTATGIGGGETCAVLISTGKIKVETSGTGETIGHIADLKIQNLTDQMIMCAIPPMILESGSGKNQHYACPKGQTVALNPHQEKTVPMDGVCVNRSKPPVGKGVTGDLVINEGNPTIPQNPNSHVPPKDANKLLRLCTSKYDAADKLQKDGQLKDLPYKDKQKQKDIVTQWSTWCDPRISEFTGAPPATKEDLRKVVYKQVPEPMTPETKKKVDKGIDTIFEKVELTTAKAKDLEKPDQFANVGLTDEEGKGESKPPATAASPNSPTTQEKSAQTPTPKAQSPQKPPFAASGVEEGLLNDPEIAARIDGLLRTRARLKQARLDHDKKKEDAIRKDPRIAQIEQTIKLSKKALANKTTAKEDKELHSNLINDKEKQLTGIRADDEKAWNQTPEGKEANKDLKDAEKDVNDAEKDAAKAAQEKGFAPYDIDKFIKELPQEKADESNQKRQEEGRKR